MEPAEAKPRRHSEIQVAEFASAVGAGVLGVGLGAYFASTLTKVSLPLLGLGLVMHGWGMFNKHRLDSRAGVSIPAWSKAFYWLCWVLLAAIALGLFL